MNLSRFPLHQHFNSKKYFGICFFLFFFFVLKAKRLNKVLEIHILFVTTISCLGGLGGGLVGLLLSALLADADPVGVGTLDAHGLEGLELLLVLGGSAGTLAEVGLDDGLDEAGELANGGVNLALLGENNELAEVLLQALDVCLGKGEGEGGWVVSNRGTMVREKKKRRKTKRWKEGQAWVHT